MEKISGAVNSATAEFLDNCLQDWHEHREAQIAGHPDKMVDPYTAILEMIRTGIENAVGARPSQRYLRAILNNWMAFGYKQDWSSDRKTREAGKPASRAAKPHSRRAKKSTAVQRNADFQADLQALLAAEQAKTEEVING